MRRIPLALIWFYQKLISPLLPRACRFYPSCSEYGKQAFIQHGFIKGTLLTSWRLLRCQPLCNGGHDPVPAVWPDPQMIARITSWTSRRKSA